MSKRRIWTDEQLIEAVPANTTLSGVLRDLGLIPAGGNFRVIKEYIAKLNLDTSHFLGRGHNKGKSFGPKGRSLEEILVKNSPQTENTRLKIRLLREGLIENRCAKCGLGPEWEGETLVLHLDHINGDNKDYRLENLQLLCLTSSI